MRKSQEIAREHDISRTVSRFDLISGRVITGDPGKKPIVLCGDIMNINEWAGLNAKISRNGS